MYTFSQHDIAIHNEDGLVTAVNDKCSLLLESSFPSSDHLLDSSFIYLKKRVIIRDLENIKVFV